MRVVGEDELAASPAGRYVVGDGFAYGCIDPALFVTVFTGRPDAASIAPLLRLYTIEHAGTPHGSLIDASALTGIDPDAFEALAAHLNTHRAAVKRVVTRQARVRPRGLAGAAVDGFRVMFDFPYPERTFETRADALAWLARADAEPAIAEMVAALAGDPITAHVRRLLATEPTMSLATAARRLGVSSRSLQRRLDEAGTRFRDASQLARVAQAKHLLGETDHKLAGIAKDLGFGSLQSFSASFRRATGLTPSAWRRGRR